MVVRKAPVSPLEAAKDLVARKFAGARVTFLGGSVGRGEARAHSDIDLVVVYEHVPRAHREAFRHRGWPVDAWVHDPETLHFALWKSERALGACPSATIVREGRALPRETAFARRLRALAGEAIEAGPLPAAEAEIIDARFAIEVGIHSVCHAPSRPELDARATRLYGDVAELFFRSRGVWGGRTADRTLRALQEADAAFHDRFVGAFRELFEGGRTEQALRLVDDLLRPFGPRLLGGFQVKLPAAARLPLGSRG